MFKKLVLLFSVFLLFFSITGCTRKKEEKDDTNRYVYVTLKINMPLNFEDLDETFIFSMTEYMEKEDIGEIIGDGSPVDEYGPYLTDIEFDIRIDKIQEFRKMLENYRFPKGSIFISDDYKSENFGDLVGVRLVFDDFSSNEIEDIYSNLSKELDGYYIYKTIYEVNDKTTLYYYGEDIGNLKNKINAFIENNNFIDYISIMDMPVVVKEG